MRLVLIANPASGTGTDPEEVAACLRRHGADVETLTPLDAGTGPETRPERIAVAGGDGTVALAADLAGRLGVPLAVVPAGTANDFARAHRLPLTLEAACEVAVRGATVRPHELGRLSDGRPFVNVASAGLAPVAAREAAGLKRVLGPFAYAIGALRAAATAAPVAAAVHVDDRAVFEGPAWQVIVAVTGAFGGGSTLGVTDPDDARLDVAVLPAGSRLGLARRAVGLRRGTITQQTGVVHDRGRGVVVELPAGSELNVDGEVVPAGKPMRAAVEGSAFTLVHA